MILDPDLQNIAILDTVLDATGLPDCFRVQVRFFDKIKSADLGTVKVWVGSKPGEPDGSPCKAWHDSDDDYAELSPVDAHAEARALLRATAFALFKRALKLS
jgi:hypothetical protein